MFSRSIFAVAVLFSWTSANSSVPPKQPTGKWIVHFDDAQCVAERNYGTAEKPIALALKQPPLGDVMQLAIIDDGVARSPTELDGTIQFGSQPPQNVSVLRFAPKKNRKVRILLSNLPSEQFSSARTAGSLRFQTRDFDESFTLVELGSLLDVMNTCVADLREVWNVGGTEKSESAVRDDAKGDLRRLFSSADYPAQALSSGNRGTVKIALLVDEAGKVADCSIIETSGVAVLDSQSCAVVKARARFTPAVGKDGKPAKDSFIQRITWRLR